MWATLGIVILLVLLGPSLVRLYNGYVEVGSYKPQVVMKWENPDGMKMECNHPIKRERSR